MRAAEPHPARLHIRLLGPVQLLVDGTPVPIGGPSVRGLMALLALDVNRVVPLDDIIDALWGGDPPTTVRTIVQGNVSHLRRILRDVPESAQLVTRPPGYQLTADPNLIDAHRARILLERSEREPLARRAELLTDAFALWQGPVLSGVPDSLRAPELDELRAAVHAARVDADLELGRHAELIAELTPMVRDNPLAERTVGQLMRALYRAGRRADALALYRRVSRHSVHALGIGPGSELHELHERMLHDEVPAAPGEDDSADDGAPPVPFQLPQTIGKLAGREAEFDWLDMVRAEASEHPAPIAVITGPAGVGKSALLVAWAHRVAHRFPDGVLYAALRGYDADHPPLSSADVLSQFLLGLGVAPARIPDGAHERLALYRSLLAGRAVLVLLDDARSAEQVRPLLPPGGRSMTVVASRARLDGLAASNGARIRALDILSAEDSVRVLTELAGPGPEAAYRELARLCGRLPLALRIAGARLAASPQWTAADLVAELADGRDRLAGLEAGHADLSVRAALDLSYDNLPDEVAEVFRLLGAFPGALVDPYLVAAVCELRPDAARRALRTLAVHHLLTEVAPDVYTAHDLVRLYQRERAAGLGDGERADVVASAVRYYRAAADAARRRLLRIVDRLAFAGDTAFALPPLAGFDAALDWFAAHWSNLLAVLEAANAAGLDTEVWQLARVAHTYRVVRPEWAAWSDLVAIGMDAAERSGDRLARCWMLISRCAMDLTFESRERSLADAEAALAIAHELEDERLVISADIHVGCALTLWERYDEAIECLRGALAAAVRLGDLALRGQASANCAEAEKRAGRYREAIANQLASLDVDRQLGDDSYAVVSLHNLAELQHAVGALGEAERYAREAVDLAAARGLAMQEGVSRAALGRIRLAVGDEAGARAELARAAELHERVGSPEAAAVRAELAEIGQP